jgi:hypothetical protein
MRSNRKKSNLKHIITKEIILRKALKPENPLPDEILWRQKDNLVMELDMNGSIS